MKKSRYTDSQILAILKQAQADAPVPEAISQVWSMDFVHDRLEDGGMIHAF